MVDTDRDEFSWLKGKHFTPSEKGDERHHRVTTMRLRGEVSYGLMVPAPAGSAVGEDVSEVLGVTRYNPVLTAKNQIPPPEGYWQKIQAVLKKYDVLLINGALRRSSYRESRFLSSKN